MKKALLLLLIIGGLYNAKAQTGSQLITVTDMTRIKQAGTASLSHNGKQVVFTVLSVEPDEVTKGEYVYRTQIWMVPADGSAPARQLTSSNTSSSQAVWSANDEQIAFVRSVKNKSQIFLLSLNGGEPTQLTNETRGASSPQWSPDGSQILYSVNLSYPEMLKDSVLNPGAAVPNWTMERPGFKTNLPQSKVKANPDGNMDAIRAFLTQNEADSKVKVFNKLNFEAEATTEPNFSFNHYFIVEAKPGAVAKPLTFGFHSYTGAVFTPDGKQLILTTDADTSLNPDRSLISAIYSMPSTGGALKRLVAEDGVSLNNGQVSPDGRYLIGFTSVPMTMDLLSRSPARPVLPRNYRMATTAWPAAG